MVPGGVFFLGQAYKSVAANLFILIFLQVSEAGEQVEEILV